MLELSRSTPGIAGWMMRVRWWLFVVGLATLPLAFHFQQQLQTDRSLTGLFAADDPTLHDYETLQSEFGGNVVVMLVYDDDELMTPAGVARNRELTEQVAALEGVNDVLSVSRLADAFSKLRPASLLQSFGLGSQASDSIAMLAPDDAVATSFRKLFASYTHSDDEQTASIVAMIDPGQTSRVIAELRKLQSQTAPTHDIALVGQAVLLEDAFDLIEADGRRLAIGTILLLSVVILVSLRDLRAMLLASLCIAWSTLSTRAVMALSGNDLSLVSTILLSLVTVIVVAAVMHLTIRSREGTRATVAAITWLAVPILWTCATDAGGFGALMMSDVRPVRSFGSMTATASLAVLVALALFAPACLSLRHMILGQWHVFPKTQSSFRAGLGHVAGWTVRRYRVVALVSIGTTIAASWYVTTLETNSSFLDNFRPSSPIVRTYQRVESKLGGAGVWDIVLPAPTEIEASYLNEVRDLEARLRSISVPHHSAPARLTKVLSLADAESVAAQVEMFKIATPEQRLAAMRLALPTFAEALLVYPSETSSGPRALRIMLRSQENLPGDVKRTLAEQVTTQVGQTDWSRWSAEGPTNDVAVVTGYSILMARLVGSLIADQWRTLGFAVGLVSILILLATRHIGETLAAVVANLLPIMITLAALGLLGGQLDLGSAMIGAVSIGLSVDGSVHYLAIYRRARRHAGVDAVAAAQQAASDLGMPILLATLALVVGFLMLTSSQFVPTSTFGVLVSVTLAFSAFTNLIILPALLIWLQRFCG